MVGAYSEAHICQCLSRIAISRRSSPLTISGNRRKTGEQFVESVLSLANGLLDLGVLPGDIVVISAFNSDWYLEWLLAVAFIGGIAAPLNYRWSSEEARYAMDIVRPVMLVTDESCHHWRPKARDMDVPSVRWYVSLACALSYFKETSHGYVPSVTHRVLTSEDIRKHSVGSLSLNYSLAPEGAVLICFTSGTTGRPKGVTVSHSALIVQSLAKIAVVGYSEDDVYLHTAPLCHIGGLSSAIAMLMVGACHVFLPRFEVKAALDAIELHNVTSLVTVPAIMADLLSLIRKNNNWRQTRSLKKVLNGAGGLRVELIKEAIKFLPRAKIVSAYGMTETCSSLTFMTLYDPTLETSSCSMQRVEHSKAAYQQLGVCVGKPAPHVEIKISGDGSTPVGRVLTRGPHLMLGYWGQIPSNSSSCAGEFLFDTGDMGSIDNFGNVWLIGRSNGCIKSGGENIYPEEVERILLQHPGVGGVVIVGIPDLRLSNMVIACVQLRENWRWCAKTDLQKSGNDEQCLSSEVLRDHCRESHLTGFKIPKRYVVWKKPFPITAMGKIRRDLIRSEVMLHLESLSFSRL